jgi:hypothetical protein
MSAQTVILRGMVRPDGSVEVPGKVEMTPGPVEVTLRAVPTTTTAASDWWEALQRLRAQQAASGSGSSAAEIDAEINALRDEWEEHQLDLERLQEASQQTSERASPPPESAE